MLPRRMFLKGALVPFAPFADVGAATPSVKDAVMVHSSGPLDVATALEHFDRLITPTNVFFMRSHFALPALDPNRPLVVDGMVKTPLTFTAAELAKQFPETSVTCVLQCAGNSRSFHRPRVPGVQWEHGAAGQATFSGVRLRDLLAKAGVDPAAAHVRTGGADVPPKREVPAFVRSIPLARAMDPSTLVAWKMNGDPLTLVHGAPLRLVVPGWAGDHWMKWLTTLHLQKEEEGGFYMKTGYRMPTEPVEPGAAVPPEKTAPLTTFPVRSIIARPTDGAKAAIGKQEIAGVAFSGEAPIDAVDVSIDGGKTWKPAKLEGDPGAGRWQLFRFTFDAKETGKITATARARDKRGNVQPEVPAWNPSGYHWNGWHRVTWEVA